MDRMRLERELEHYGLTAFQKRVLLATLRIRRGEVATYKQIAKMAGSPRAYRAVGTALKGNPLPIRIPCHRVVRSDGRAGGYSGVKDSRKKVALLKSEGAFADGKLSAMRNTRAGDR